MNANPEDKVRDSSPTPTTHQALKSFGPDARMTSGTYVALTA